MTDIARIGLNESSEPNGLKCDVGMAQQEYSKNKIYATVYGYYINIYFHRFHRCIMHFLKMAHMMIIEVMIRYLYIKAFFCFFVFFVLRLILADIL